MVVEVKSNVYRGENESDEMKWWRWGVDGGCDGRLVIKVKRAIIHYSETSEVIPTWVRPFIFGPYSQIGLS